ncbi:serine hydrolase domain-containing protein [Massilia sp. CCM 9210]|uniref:serine hydrolase domain-containing protein n=1 Tax=Massilia scottii TaxID=3057166 RepID=UPI002796B485|nr:serine hydrolase domain-containing protein [Massilia sp. CCM 9210]MDQ1811853.1 serine hydrolase domain-containing protein [Massilia sp. CCM 9210]
MNRRNLFIAALATSLLAACGGGGGGGAAPPAGDVVLAPVTTLAAGVTQTAQPEVDQYMQGQLLEQRIPGMTLVVVRDGTVVYGKGYGYADREMARPVKPEDRFEIGSISKSFAATAIMLLVEEGKISLDDKLDKFIGAVPPQWSGITIRHLLNHSSGLPEYPDDSTFADIFANKILGEDDMLARFRAYSLSWEPGTKYRYCNVGYDILGIVVRRVTGKGYFDFLKERVFTPLGMHSARLVAPKPARADSAIGYELKDGKHVPFVTTDAMSVYLGMAASGIELSAMDMAKWDAALYTDKILKQSTLALMWTNNVLVQAANADNTGIYYGLGWQLRTQNGKRWVYHSGGMPGYVTDFMRYPDQKLTIIVFTNLSDQHANARNIVRAVAPMFGQTL